MNNDILKAGMIAGGALEAAGGFMTRGEELENQGATDFRQVTCGLAHGVFTGVIGVGVGAGSVAVTSALRGILKK